MKKLYLFLFSFLPFFLIAQSPWIFENDFFHAYCLTESYDGGMIVGGVSYNYGYDGKVIKVDNTGELLWEFTLDPNHYSSPTQLREYPDGSLLIGGITDKYDEDKDGYLLKLNSCGEQLWFKNIGLSNDPDNIKDIFLDGEFIYLLQVKFPDPERFTLSKFSSENGDSLWSKSNYIPIGGTPRDLLKCSDGGFLLTGNAWAPPYYDQESSIIGKRSTLIKTDSLGELEWFDFYNWELDSNNLLQYSYGYSSVELPDSSFLTLAFDRTDTNNMNHLRPILYKTSYDGEMIWTKFIADTSLTYQGGQMVALNDSTIIVATSPAPQDDSYNTHMIVLKMDTLGNILSSHTDTNELFLIRDLAITSDNKIITTPGSTSTGNYHLYVVKLDAETMLLDTFLINDTTNYNYLCSSQIQDHLFLFPDDSIGIDKISFINISISPNPAKDFVNISLNQLEIDQINLIDISGKLINNFSVDNAYAPIELDIHGQSPGIYFLEFINESEIIRSEKLIIL